MIQIQVTCNKKIIKFHCMNNELLDTLVMIKKAYPTAIYFTTIIKDELSIIKFTDTI